MLISFETHRKSRIPHLTRVCAHGSVPKLKVIPHASQYSPETWYTAGVQCSGTRLTKDKTLHHPHIKGGLMWLRTG